MKEIQKISEQIDEELKDSKKYLQCAYKYRDEHPDLADMYYDLSLAEMDHVTILHDMVVKIIEKYSETNSIPEGMQMIYDYLHEKHMKVARKIKMKQDEYKE